MPPLRSPTLSPTVRRQYQVMKRQQRYSGNLTTVDHTGGVMIMSTFPYPVDEEGNPIVPPDVHDYLKSRVAPLPICFCNALARFKKVVRTGEHAGKAAYMCGLGHECPFWFCPDDILYGPAKENDDMQYGSIRYANYPLPGQTKLPADIFITPCELGTGKSTPQSTQGSNIASGSSASSNSTPSLNSEYSSSEFSWSPIRNLLNMRVPDSPLKTGESIAPTPARECFPGAKAVACKNSS
ncbi:hypothetical protein C8R43DRAFT_167278 [Mycena crocata]|nr:hypothetical protein C8R43DRAFT_167278 [Mycena crocata]